MTDGMKVDPVALRARSPKFATAGDKLEKAFEALETVQDTEGKCWGDDKAGEEFGPKYSEAAKNAVKGGNSLAEALRQRKAGLDETAKQWESDDQHGAEGIGKAGGEA